MPSSFGEINYCSRMFSHAQAPNALRLVRERPNGADAKRYRRIRHNAALYRAAAKLWQQGLNMSEAIQIVTEAIMETPN